jgi:hypothetical protein
MPLTHKKTSYLTSDYLSHLMFCVKISAKMGGTKNKIQINFMYLF